MNTQELLRNIVLKLSRYRIIIVLVALAMGVLFFLYARTIYPVYSVRSSVFPLNAAPENSLASSALSSILGISEPKSFSQEAQINILELAQSRNTREAVAKEKLPGKGNKMIAEVLIENYNKTKPLFSKKIVKPENEALLIATGGDILKNNITAKINKNGILEVVFNSTDKDLVTPVSYIIIEKISEFYKDLKIRKAKFDYDFTVAKVDSLEEVISNFDRRAVGMSNTTMFVPSGKLQNELPKENLLAEKERVMRQRNATADNREEALWRLQKVTPIIATLDKPEPPYDVEKPSSIVYAIIGMIVGGFLAIIFLITGILYRFTKHEMKKAIFSTAS